MGWLDKAKDSFGRNGTVRQGLDWIRICVLLLCDMWHMMALGKRLQDMCLMTDGRTDGWTERNLQQHIGVFELFFFH